PIIQYLSPRLPRNPQTAPADGPSPAPAETTTAQESDLSSLPILQVPARWKSVVPISPAACTKLVHTPLWRCHPGSPLSSPLSLPSQNNVPALVDWGRRQRLCQPSREALHHPSPTISWQTFPIERICPHRRSSNGSSRPFAGAAGVVRAGRRFDRRR